MDHNIGQRIATYLLEETDQQVSDVVLLEWLAENPSHQQLFEEYKKIWNEVLSMNTHEPFDVSLAWEKVNRANQMKVIRKNRLANFVFLLSGVAATIVFVIYMFLAGYIESVNIEADKVSMSTEYGNRSQMVLPDGTKVKLNVGTTVEYRLNKQKNIREVNFKGEGFFEVAKSEIPFVITTSDNLQVKVLGTQFGLTAYEEDNGITAALVEGSIELNDQHGNFKMAPGEIVRYDKKTKNMSREKIDITHTYGWLTNKLYMDNMSLSEVCKKLERWYDVKIEVPLELGGNIHYTGVLQEKSVIDVLDALRNLSKINYFIKESTIIITPR